MNSDLPDRGLVREYLLGRLDDKKELEEQLSHDICVNDELSEMVESVEEEIIEDVLDGTLGPADKNAVDGYFLRPPERKEKLRFARLLRHISSRDASWSTHEGKRLTQRMSAQKGWITGQLMSDTLISERMGISPRSSCSRSRV